MKTGPERNDLLFRLPQQVKERLFPHLREIELPLGKEIDTAGQQVTFVYFPVDCIIALTYATFDGKATGFSLLGRESIVNISAILDAGSSSNQALVVKCGSAYKLPVTHINNECKNDYKVLRLMLRYAQALVTQIAQTAVCYRHHTVDQQVCRMLLMFLDRLPGDELIMTQQLFANMLGVRREGVTQAANRLEKLGVIHHTRGHVTVLDRPRLEALSCECYDVVKRETDRLAG